MDLLSKQDLFDGNFKKAKEFYEAHVNVANYFSNSPSQRVSAISMEVLNLGIHLDEKSQYSKQLFLRALNAFTKEVVYPIVFQEGVNSGAQEASEWRYIECPYDLYSIQGQIWCSGWHEGYRKEKGLESDPSPK